MRFVAAFGALAIIVAACGGGEGSDSEQVTVGAGDPIEIRALNVLSGPNASLGAPNEITMRMAIEDFGPIHGHEVNVGTTVDDSCNADGGQAGAQTLVADEQVVGIIGTACSGAAAAAMPLVTEAGLVMISPANTSPSMTSDLEGTEGENHYDGYFRTAHNDLFQGQAAANFVFNNLQLTQAAAIHDGDPYTEGLVDAFINAFETLGGEVVLKTATAVGATDLSGLLTEVAASEPELVFMPIFPDPAIALVQQAADVAGMEDVILMGADGISVENFMNEPESEGMYFSGPDTQFGTNTNEETGVSGEELLARYNEEVGASPSADFWGHAYDATVMLLAAIRDVAVVDGDVLRIDRQALRDAMAAYEGFEGVIGTINCDEFGDCGAAKISIFQHNNLSDHAASKSNILYTYPEE
jgi:branched-chain amino acid transport system substrate-binding protein